MICTIEYDVSLKGEASFLIREECLDFQEPCEKVKSPVAAVELPKPWLSVKQELSVASEAQELPRSWHDIFASMIYYINLYNIG